MSKRGGTLLQRFRVPLGFLFAAVFLLFARPQFWTLVIGGSLAFVGILIRAWASGHIRKNLELAVSGPYSYTRNPLYLGSFILGVGFTIAGGVWWLSFIFIALFLGIYLPVMRVEAKELTDIFGEKYQEYAREVPLFFPRITGGKKLDAKFDFQLYLRYREYRAALGWFLALAVLTFKAFYQGEVFMNLKRLFFSLFLITGLCAFLSAQPSAKLNLYKAGEKLSYEGNFSKLLLRGIDVAELSMTVYNSPDKDDYFIHAEARSKGTLLKLFNFSFYQKVESTVDGDSLTILKTVKRDEQGDRVRDSEAIFDYRDEKVTYVETDPKDPQKPPRRVATEINTETQDLLSGIYALRRLPFALGKTFTLSVSDSGMVYHVPIRVTGREKQKTVLGKVMCWKVEPEVFGENRMIEQKGGMTIWITDDNRRIPVRSKIETKIGKVEIKLRKVEKAK